MTIMRARAKPRTRPMPIQSLVVRVGMVVPFYTVASAASVSAERADVHSAT
jgi:hypothetical protein